jgi:UDP-N-acetylglucosamine 2-epimerase
MKIVSIVGARPQFIKASVVSRELRKICHEVLIHTGQHYDFELSKIFFQELNIPEPDYNLDVGSGSHGTQTGEMLKRIEQVLLKEQPDFALVYGDTNSTLAGALASVKLHISTVHVEAGLRSFDKSMPEEVNRILTDHCSDILLCPTKKAIENLKHEGIEKEVFLTGDVMVDVLLNNKKIAEENSKILEILDLKTKEYLVATIHRESNTDNKENLNNIVDAFCEIDEMIVFPAHPRTVKYLKKFGLYDKLSKHIKLIPPLGYIDFLKLMNNANKIITDSGGVQKEAYILGIPCITLRDTTEWIETIEDGWNVIIGSDREKIIQAVEEFEPDGNKSNVFGDGTASNTICKIFEKYLADR